MDPSELYFKKRHVQTAMVFFLFLITPSFVDHQMFKRYKDPIDISNSYALGYLASQLFGGLLATIIGGHQVKNYIYIEFSIF